MKRIGKIAQLPQEVREQLNRRLQEEQSGKELVAWLNGLAKVRKVLAEEFGRRPISEQNLSDWKKGGYKDWVRNEEARQRMERVAEQAHDLTGCGYEGEPTDRLSALLVTELAAAIEALRAEPLPPVKRWQRMREILRDVTQLRQAEHRAAWLRIGQERWGYDAERLECEQKERVKQELQRIREAPLLNHLKMAYLVQIFGGGKKGREMAARVFEFEEGLPARKKGNQSQSSWIERDPGEEDPIEPDPGGSSTINPDQGK
jgi:hypothetical protein